MGLDGKFVELQHEDGTHQGRAICLHAYSDLSCVSPVVFLYLLKECYAYGTCKATKKFRALQQQVHQVLYNSPQPGPAVFVAHCLYVLPILEEYSEGFSHLVISALRRFLKVGTTSEDLLEAKSLAARLFLFIVGGSIIHDERVLIKMLEVFEISMINIENSMCNAELNSSGSLELARTFVDKYIFKLIESESYMTAVTLLEHFSIRQSGESFLMKIMQNKDYRAADKWATFMGKPMLCVLVQEYSERKLPKHAYDIIKKNNLRKEFPEIYHKCKESSLKKLAEKGCWDVAEAKTNGDKQFLEYLVYLAMEAGYPEKVDELCDRYSLEGFINFKEPETSLTQNRYLQLNELDLEDIIWVDEVNGLRSATCHIEECKVVGIDCEWKPNYEKGSKPNKVSIMQIASEKMVFIIDLIKLFEDVPDILDNCLTRILHAPRILKLGYNFQCDVNQLAHSYGELMCFKHYEMLLDIQNVFKEPRGGLSGLAMKILGAGLNKTRRNSNWEQRPLTRNQLEYAALDAAVLIHIFRHVRSTSQIASVPEGPAKIEWKSHIVSYVGNPKKTKKEAKDAGIDALSQLVYF
ncbi:exonuclease mut-7 homolog isoform X4 [Camellia sinensis]|uniref:exonuclease mut-7 homolog isoform X4 n=1 Tax=Camellia sinensis TaxID=4442 RepID=UPI00103624F8|nr:exonuclease mut-7 homolog isoform X4 [Camellia sinensis]